MFWVFYSNQHYGEQRGKQDRKEDKKPGSLAWRPTFQHSSGRSPAFLITGRTRETRWLTRLARVTASSGQIRLLCPEITTVKTRGTFNPPPTCFRPPHLTYAHWSRCSRRVYPLSFHFPSTSPWLRLQRQRLAGFKETNPLVNRLALSTKILTHPNMTLGFEPV